MEGEEAGARVALCGGEEELNHGSGGRRRRRRITSRARERAGSVRRGEHLYEGAAKRDFLFCMLIGFIAASLTCLGRLLALMPPSHIPSHPVTVTDPICDPGVFFGAHAHI